VYTAVIFAMDLNVDISGYKQAKGTSLSPLVPLCPLKPLKGFGDPKSDFEFGYTIGFKKGMAAR